MTSNQDDFDRIHSKLKDYTNIEERNEEFNNFMHRVTEVSNIVKKLSCQDKKVQEVGTLEAERYLNGQKKGIEKEIDEDVQVKIKSERTVLNRRAFKEEKKEEMSEGTMSQEAFMAAVSKDAEERRRDREIRKEKSETLRVQAQKAFRRGEFEKAFCCYEKAISYIKDSPMLYINRGLVQIKLGRCEKAVEDFKTALRLNEGSLKARLLMAKAYYVLGDEEGFKSVVDEVKEVHPDKKDMICGYIEDLKKEKSEVQL